MSASNLFFYFTWLHNIEKIRKILITELIRLFFFKLTFQSQDTKQGTVAFVFIVSELNQ